MSKVWFITGTSKGFGRVWAEAALARGDRVVATARNADTLTPLVEAYGDLVLPLALDVNDKAAIDAAVKRAHEHFGRLDVVVNNAGYGLFGAIEEITERQARDQVETNLFGPLWVTQAVLPILREQGSGHIIQVSSIGGVQAFPTLGLYHASKWALEGFSQSVAAEVADLGIKVTIVEPTGPAILDLVDAADPPLRVFFGIGPLDIIRTEYAARIATWERWDALSREAHGAAN